MLQGVVTRLSVRVYKKKYFVQLASILLTSCPGVNSPLHVISSDDEVITACKKTYGDFLKSKKMLTEALTVIVLCVCLCVCLSVCSCI